MSKFILRRLIQAIPTFFGITILSYALMLGAPGGPVAALTFNPRMTPQERDAFAARLGVNDPLPVQYLRWLIGDDWMRWDTNGDGIADHSFLLPLDADGDGVPEPPGQRLGILRGDFGISFFQPRPVLNIIVERIPATFELGISALIISIIIGVPVGILAAIGRGGSFDNITRVLAVLFNAVPGFWLGLIVILFFGATLHVLPMGSQCATTLTGVCPPIYKRLNYLILPALVLAAGPIASYSRFMRASMLETISKDYIRTAQAKGLSSRVVWFKHGARNALLPLATFLGLAIAGILGGAPVIETIFSWPGLGRLTVSAVVQQDYPIVMATVIITAATTLFGLILTDILYAYIDPRIRFS